MHQDIFQIEDLFKASAAIVAGVLLGLERELKDKRAGLKTISIICLGATLFTIMSERMGMDGNTTQIAAYVVSGVGFIGAGAIFKDGFTISGLTTASLVWLAAAIGVSIGFGEYYAAGIFLGSSFIIIVVLPSFISKRLRDMTTVQLVAEWPLNKPDAIPYFEAALQKTCSSYVYKQISIANNKKTIHYEVVMKSRQKTTLYGLVSEQVDIENYTLTYA